MNGWIRTIRAAEGAAEGTAEGTPRARLLCLPHAGGSVSTFHRFARSVDRDVAVIGVQYPGRGDRLLEPPIADLEVLVAGIVDALTESSWLDRPFALLGHSFGALVGFVTARALRERGLPTPALLVFGGRAPPHLPFRGEPLHELPTDEAFVEALIERYGDPDGMLRNPDIAEMIVPALRADIGASASWEYRSEPPFAAPLLAFAGEEDAELLGGALDAWGEHTDARFERCILPGGHFVFAGDAAPLVGPITALLADL